MATFDFGRVYHLLNKSQKMANSFGANYIVSSGKSLLNQESVFQDDGNITLANRAVNFGITKSQFVWGSNRWGSSTERVK